MHPYLASRFAQDREEEFRRRAEIFRLLAEANRAEARWRKLLSASLRRAAPVFREARQLRGRLTVTG